MGGPGVGSFPGGQGGSPATGQPNGGNGPSGGGSPGSSASASGGSAAGSPGGQQGTGGASAAANTANGGTPGAAAANAGQSAGTPGTPSITIGKQPPSGQGQASTASPTPDASGDPNRRPPPDEFIPGSGGGNRGTGGPGEPLGPLNRLAGRPLETDQPKWLGPAPKPQPRLAPNRDWVIQLECTADAVIFPGGVQQVPKNTLGRSNDPNNPLLVALRQMIQRRQATLRPGEAPYRPHIRFLVRPDGLRTYYLAFPALEALKVPMTRENLNPEENEN